MGRFSSAFILLQRSLTGSVSLDDRVDSSSCAPAAAGFMMVVGGSDCEEQRNDGLIALIGRKEGCLEKKEVKTRD
jgi:hypothetical protein